MFVFNVKVPNNLIKKIGVVGVILIIVIVFIIVGCRFCDSVSKVNVNDKDPSSYTNCIDINSANYTSFLKDCHENMDSYIGKNFKFTGFIYKLFDFNDNQFVLSREMIISSDNQAVIVGILCYSDSSINFKDSSWVEVEGVIEKGNYHGERPIVHITNIKETSTPNEEYVYPPDNNFIPNI